MTIPFIHRLSRRERQIMDTVYRFGDASVQQVLDDLPDPPSYSSIRALMRILEDKGHLTHVEERGKYIYRPTQARQSAAKTALRQVVDTFFGGSVQSAVATLLSDRERSLAPDQIEILTRLIDTAGAEHPADKEE